MFIGAAAPSPLHDWLHGLVDAYLQAPGTTPEDVERRIVTPTVGPYLRRLAAFAYAPPPPVRPAADEVLEEDGERDDADGPPATKRRLVGGASGPPAVARRSSAGLQRYEASQVQSDDDEDDGTESATPLVQATVPAKASRTGAPAGGSGGVFMAVSAASKERERMVASMASKPSR